MSTGSLVTGARFTLYCQAVMKCDEMKEGNIHFNFTDFEKMEQ